MRKKILLLLLVFLMMLSITPIVNAGTNPGQVNLKMESVGTTGAYKLVISAGATNGIQACDVILSYDNTILTPIRKSKILAATPIIETVPISDEAAVVTPFNITAMDTDDTLYAQTTPLWKVHGSRTAFRTGVYIASASSVSQSFSLDSMFEMYFIIANGKSTADFSKSTIKIESAWGTSDSDSFLMDYFNVPAGALAVNQANDIAGLALKQANTVLLYSKQANASESQIDLTYDYPNSTVAALGSITLSTPLNVTTIDIPGNTVNTPNTLTLSAAALDTEGDPYTSPVSGTWSLVEGYPAGVTLTPGSPDGLQATLSVPAGTSIGTATVKFTSGSVEASKTITIQKAASVASSVKLYKDATLLTTNSETLIVPDPGSADMHQLYQAEVYDQYDVLMPAAVVDWTASTGTNVTHSLGADNKQVYIDIANGAQPGGYLLKVKVGSTELLQYSIHSVRTVLSGMFAAISDQAYTGSQITPTLTNGVGSNLVLNTDYTVAYGSNITVGNGTAVVTGIGNYTGTATLNFAITPKMLTLDVRANNKTYDGKTTGEGAVNILGQAVGDDVAVTGTFTFTDANAADSKTVLVTGITLSGEDAANYTVASTETTSANIDKAWLYATVEDASKVYGTANPDFPVAVAGFVNGENGNTAAGYIAPTASSLADTTTHVGTAEIGITSIDAANYQFDSTDKATLTITKRALTATATADNKDYDGLTISSGSISLAGFVNGDLGTATGSFAFSDATVGIDKTVNVSNIVLDEVSAANYTVNTSAAATATISKAKLTATVEDSSKIYGSVNPTFPVTVTGFASGESAVNAANYTAPTASSSADTTTIVGTTPAITISGGAATNYFFDIADTAILSITPKLLTATATANDKVYDGKTDATGTISLAGTINNDVVTVSGTFQFANKNVDHLGNAMTVNVSGITLGGANAANYTVNTETVTSAMITRAVLIATVGDYSREYGALNPDFSVTVEGFVGGDTAQTDADYSAPAAGTGANLETGIGPVEITISGGTSWNYSFNNSDKGTLTVTAKALTATATAVNKEYDGLISASGNIVLAGLVNNDPVVASGNFTFDSPNAAASKTVNVHGITLNGINSGNYTVNLSATTTAAITKAPLTATVGNYSKIYRENNPAFTVDVTGFVNGENSTAAGYQAPTAICSANASSNVGDYTISLIGGAAENYSFNTSDTATLTINRKSLNNVQVDAIADQAYTGSTINPTVVVTDGLNTLNLAADYSVQYGAAIDVGSVAITITGLNNYIDNTGVSFNIVKAPYTAGLTKTSLVVSNTAAIGKSYNLGGQLTAGFKDVVYSSLQYTGNEAGLLTGVPSISSEGMITYDVSAKTKNTSGVISVVVSSKNYADVTALITIQVTDVVPTWTPVDTLISGAAYTYGDMNGKVALPASGSAVAGDVTVEGTFTYKDASVVQSQGAKMITVIFTVSSAGNYFATEVEKDYNITIAAKPITVTADHQSQYYGEVNPTLTFTHNPADLVGSDTKATLAAGLSLVYQPVTDYAAGAVVAINGQDNNSSDNYAITVTSGSLTIQKADISSITTANPALGILANDASNTTLDTLKSLLPANVDIAFGTAGTATLPITWAYTANPVFNVKGAVYTLNGSVTPGTNFNAYTNPYTASITVTPVIGTVTTNLPLSVTVAQATANAADAYDDFGLPTSLSFSFDQSVTAATYTNLLWDKTVSTLKAIPVESQTVITMVQGNATGNVPTWITLTSPVAITVKVTAKLVIPEASISLTPAVITYGDTYTPTASLTGSYGDTTPAVTYSYQNASGTALAAQPSNAGNYYVTATYENATHKGSKQVSLTINAKPLTLAMFEVLPAVTYTGNQFRPEPVVAAGASLVKDTDYLVTYAANLQVGAGTVTVTGNGNYSGSVDLTFAINIRPITADLFTALPAVTYQGSQFTPDPIQANGYALVKNTDYTLSYGANLNAGVGSVIVSGGANCSGSATLTFTINPAAISSVMFNTLGNETYTRNQITPLPTVAAGYSLVKDTDYTLSYTANTNIGSGTVTVTGINNYSGSFNLGFTILPQSITSAMFQAIPAVTYTGTAITPDPSVAAGYTLVKNTDYQLAYTANTNAGTGSVTVSGIGNYTGSIVLNFTIQPAPLQSTMFQTLADAAYTGLQIKPEPLVAVGSALQKTRDYVLTYAANLLPGGAIVTVSGTGNYSGSVDLPFTITVRVLTADMFRPIATRIYNTHQQTPEPVTVEGYALVKDTDYSVSFGENLRVGTGTVTVTAIEPGNCSGSVVLSFRIEEEDLTPVVPVTPPVIPPVTPPVTPPVENPIVVFVNGQDRPVGALTTETTPAGNTEQTITINDTEMNTALTDTANGATITLPFTEPSAAYISTLNGQTVSSMEQREAVLEIRTENVTYTIPASEINIDSISSQLGQQVELRDIQVSISITESSAETARIVEDTANRNHYSVVVQPVDFEITCTSGTTTVDVSRFNAYVERLIAIPDGIDPSRITTGIVLNSDGTFSHVPTTIVNIGGKYFAKINSLTNSTYSVIYSPVTFGDTAGHWAVDAIQNMGSRLIVSGMGDGNYEPNRAITRAEFAAILVRALGLQRAAGVTNFPDVASTDWFAGSVQTAVEYGLIAGYDNGKFGPLDNITREQAMTMIARAMKLTQLQADFSTEEITAVLAGFTDAAETFDYAKAGIAACVKNGIVSGRSAAILAPKASITRAEVAVIIEQLLQESNLI